LIVPVTIGFADVAATGAEQGISTTNTAEEDSFRESRR
jgi:hypothetical protein